MVTSETRRPAFQTGVRCLRTGRVCFIQRVVLQTQRRPGNSPSLTTLQPAASFRSPHAGAVRDLRHRGTAVSFPSSPEFVLHVRLVQRGGGQRACRGAPKRAGRPGQRCCQAPSSVGCGGVRTATLPPAAAQRVLLRPSPGRGA